jgi:hypothetical protein
MSALSPVFPQERTLAASAISSGKWVGGEEKYFCGKTRSVIFPSGRFVESVSTNLELGGCP